MKDIKIGERIRKFRLEKGISTSILAQMTGLSQQYISLIENEKTTPSLKSLYKIAVALGTNLSFLLEDPKENKFFYSTDEDLRTFIINEENAAYLKLAKEMKDNNISTDVMKAFIDIVVKNRNN